MFVLDQAGMPDSFWEIAYYYGAENVVFSNQPKRNSPYGSYCPRNNTIMLYANTHWKCQRLRSLYPHVNLMWPAILHTLLHEIRHQQQHERGEFTQGFEESRQSREYSELDAQAFASKEMLRLAALDERIFMPPVREWKGYFGARGGKLQGRYAQWIREGEYRWLVPLYGYMESAGAHVPYDDELKDYRNLIIHKTPSGRKYRYLTLSDTVWYQFLNGRAL